jgi:hypothetical protein
MKTLDKEDLTTSGFILDTGEYIPLTAGESHADTAESFDATLDNFLSQGIARVKIDHELLCIEHNLDLTNKQKRCIIRIIRANKFYSLIYFGLKSKIDVELNEYNGIKPFMLEKLWSK